MTIFPRAVAALFLLACSATAQADNLRRPLNPRRRKKPTAAAAIATPASGRLLAGRWSEEVDTAVRRLIEINGSSATIYDAAVPPAAALALDGAAYARGDPAEAVFHKLVVEAQFKFSDDFWKNVPIGYGRQKIRAAYEQFSSQPRTLWPSLPSYRQFRKYFFASYLDTCGKVGRKECRSYLARLLIGFSEAELRDYASVALMEEAAERPRIDLEGESDADPEAVHWPRGLVAASEWGGLARALRATGFDVWALGLEAQPILVAAAIQAGVDQSRCLGIKQKLERDNMTGYLSEPIPIRSGSVDAIITVLGRPPLFALGARPEDIELLRYARGLRVFVDNGWVEAARQAKQEGALIQPALARPGGLR